MFAVSGAVDSSVRFHARRIINYPREAAKVAEEVVTMRMQMNCSEVKLFDIEHGPGRLVDIEFLVQFIVLGRAADDRSLANWRDYVRQLEVLTLSGYLSVSDAQELTRI